MANADTPGDLAHISIHKDLSCHVKARVEPGKPMRAVHQWRFPAKLANSNAYRLLEVCIPSVALEPVRGSIAHPATKLLEPPDAGEQLTVTLFAQAGAPVLGHWPGRTTMNSRFVGRMEVEYDDGETAFFFSAVATTVPEYALYADMARQPWPGEGAPRSPRAMVFSLMPAGNELIPTLAEMPMGHRQ